MRKTVLAGAAAAMIAFGSAQAARFEPTYGDGGYGVSVSVTDDGCTASVLFDSASVSDAQDWYAAQVPLMIDGRSTVRIDARGFFGGSADAAATVAADGRERTLYFDESDEGNWSRSFTLRDASGDVGLWMSLGGYGYYDQQSNMLSLDSIDLVIEDCGDAW